MAYYTVYRNSLTLQWTCWVFISIFLCELGTSRQFSRGQCRYDFSLQENKLIVTCGSETFPSNDHSHDYVHEKTSERASVKHHQAPASSDYRSDVMNISTSTDEDLQAVKKAIDNLMNINKTLLLVKTQVSEHMEKLHNGSFWFSQTESKIQRLLAHIHRRKGKSAPSYRALAATLQNQYNYVREGVQAQTNGITESMTALMTMLTVEEEMISSSFALAQAFSRQLKDLSSLIATLKGRKNQFQHNFAPQPEPPTTPLTTHLTTLLTTHLTTPFTTPESSLDKEISLPEDKTESVDVYRLGRVEGRIHEQCQPMYGIGPIEAWVKQRTTQGTVMVDSKDTYGYIWIMYGYGGTDKIVEFESILDLENSIPKRTITLPFQCEGTGQVVFDGSLYCLKAKTNHIVRFELREKSLLADVVLEGAGVYNTYPYQFGGLSDLDFAVDEHGLWVIYATKASKGKIIVSKLDPVSLSVKRSWVANIEKKLVGNTFMVCGVMYAIDSFSSSPTFIKFVYDTNTESGRVLDSSEIPFMNAVDQTRSFTVMVDYEPRDQKLYTWNNGRVEIYPIMF